jgi:hypothetical protein
MQDPGTSLWPCVCDGMTVVRPCADQKTMGRDNFGHESHRLTQNFLLTHEIPSSKVSPNQPVGHLRSHNFSK